MTVTLEQLVREGRFNARNPRHRSLLYGDSFDVDARDARRRHLSIIQQRYREEIHNPYGAEYRRWLLEGFALLARRPPKRVAA